MPENMISVIPRKTLIVGFHFNKLGCCKPTTFPTPPRFFFLLFVFFFKFGDFFQNRNREQLLVNSSENIK